MLKFEFPFSFRPLFISAVDSSFQSIVENINIWSMFIKFFKAQPIDKYQKHEWFITYVPT